MLAMSVLSLASLFAQVHPKFLSNHWYMRRLFLYAVLLFAGIVPVLHWVVDNGGFSDPLVKVRKEITMWGCPCLILFLGVLSCSLGNVHHSACKDDTLLHSLLAAALVPFKYDSTSVKFPFFVHLLFWQLLEGHSTLESSLRSGSQV